MTRTKSIVGARSAPWIGLALAAALTGCGDDGMGDLDGAVGDGAIADARRTDRPAIDAPIADGATPDGATPDGGEEIDGGGDTDGGEMDGGGVDAGMVDGGPPPACGAIVLPSLSTEDIAGAARFTRPVLVRQAPGVSDTLWVVEPSGLIRLVRGGAILSTPFLDITARIGTMPSGGSERGLLGLAFHPNYAANGRFFVMYTPTSGTFSNHDIVAEYARSTSDPDVASGTEVARLLDTGASESNHNGGNLEFGPDNRLYVGTGDGGGGGDGHGAYGNGLNLMTTLGKILRLDVDASGSGYAAAGNPFSLPTGLPQIWAYGLRNPWRFGFDRATGDLYIGDVGQNQWEEIDFQPASSTGGENYGWRAYEGNEVFDSANVGRVPVHAEPIVVNEHGSSSETLRGACSIAGGRVYRGSAIPELDGVYIFGDYCSSDVAAFKYCDGAVHGLRRVPDLMGVAADLVSVGEDNAGELYLVYLSGRVVRIVSP